MNCPACAKKLHRFEAAGVTLDGCAACGGIWFDEHELEQVNLTRADTDETVAEISRPPSLKVDEDAIRQCPKCKRVKTEKKLFSLGSGVIMDVCPKCSGVWLDFGELEKIHESLHPGPPPRRFVARDTKPVKIPITFELVQQVKNLRAMPKD